MGKFEGRITITPDNNEPTIKDVMDSAEETISANPEKKVEVTRRLPGQEIHIGIKEEENTDQRKKEKSGDKIEDDLGIDRVE